MICFDHCELLSSLRTEADPSVVGSSMPLVVDTGWDPKRGTRASVATLFALLDTSPRHHISDPSYHGSDPVTHPLRLSEHPYHTFSVQHSVTHHSSSRFPSHSPSSTTARLLRRHCPPNNLYDTVSFLYHSLPVSRQPDNVVPVLHATWVTLCILHTRIRLGTYAPHTFYTCFSDRSQAEGRNSCI